MSWGQKNLTLHRITVGLAQLYRAHCPFHTPVAPYFISLFRSYHIAECTHLGTLSYPPAGGREGPFLHLVNSLYKVINSACADAATLKYRQTTMMDAYRL